MSGNKVIVFGSGMVGSAIAADLSKKFRVTLADIDLNRALKVKEKNPGIEILQLDVNDSMALKSSLSSMDLVVSAVPGFLGFKALRRVIEAGMSVVDISFCPENTLDLNSLAIEKNVTAFVDSGIAPGMDNLFLGYHNKRMEITHFECLVGGLPKIKKWPFYYKAPFSPVDVIEEYTRPVTYIEDGKRTECEPLEDSELIEFRETGKLEAFLTDGLRSIISTMPHIGHMKEKTLRYPGHADLIRALKAGGFFSREQVNINGSKVTPFEVTARILLDAWKLEEGEEDITVMRVLIKGKDKSGKSVEVIYDLFDEYSKETGTTSMARTTGYTAGAVASLFLEGYFSDKGIFPLEIAGEHEDVFRYVLDYHKSRGVIFRMSEKAV